MSEVVNAVAHTYNWDGYQAHEILPVPDGWIGKYTGRYRYDAVLAISVTSTGEKLFMSYPGGEPEELIYTGDELLMRRGRSTPITFSDSENGPSFTFVLDSGDKRLHRRLADDERLPGEVLAQGRYDDALAAFRAALVAEPGEDSLSEQSLNNTGLSSLEDSQDFAIEMLRINTDLYPDSANTWDSLAYAYQQAGNREKAIENFRNALKRDPEFASALKGLAELETEQ